MRRKSRLAKERGGFTLIETLMVASLLAVIGLAIYQSLSNGIKVWERSQRFGLELDVMLFLDRFTQDINNAFPFSLIEAEGGYERFAFPARVRVLADKHVTDGRVDYTQQIGRIEYSYDPLKDVVSRKVQNYAQAVGEETEGDTRVLVTPVDKLTFAYYFWDREDKKYVMDTKVEERLPDLVRVDLEFTEDTGQRRKMSRLIPLPLRSL